MQLEEHFSRPMKEFVSWCLKKNPAEVGSSSFKLTCISVHYLAIYCNFGHFPAYD